MTKEEMDAAIRAAMKTNPRSMVTVAERVCFIAGMREAAKIADGEYLAEDLSEESDNAYDRAIADVIGAINRTADWLSK